MKTTLFRLLVTISFGCLTLFAASIPVGAQTYVSTVLHSFGNTSGDGQNPEFGHLIADGSGNLYGTTKLGGASGNGTVFELVNSSGTYTEKVLYSFGNSPDAANPSAGVIMDGQGNLYGTAGGGATGAGTVFELVNSSGTYTEKVLYSFGYSPDGAGPQGGGVIVDGSGNLYGTTYQGGANGYGTVFELVNSSGTYAEKVLYSFANSPDGAYPFAGVIMVGSGNLYGTTQMGGLNAGGFSTGGIVFELVNSSGTYSEKVLHSFPAANLVDGDGPTTGLIMDGSGNLYGTTVGGGAHNSGTVFELAAPLSAGMGDTVLHSFTGVGSDGNTPEAGLLRDGSGNLYGTTFGGGAYFEGIVFELVNSSGSYSENVIHSFQTGSPLDGAGPVAGLIMDGSGNLYGTTPGGGVSGAVGAGTVFELSPFSGQAQTTTTILASSQNPADAGQIVKLFAMVTAALRLPTGTMTFSTGGTVLGTAPVLGGVAGLDLGLADILGIGTFGVTAQYTPDSVAFASSSTTISQTVTEQGVVLNNGNNTLNGNQTVNGTVSATSFTGNGSGLTGVNAATAATASGLTCTGCVGNTQLAVSYAGSASQGGPATSALNALMLGGLSASAFQPAGSYATTGANLFSGNQSITGNLMLTGSLTGGSANLTGLTVTGNSATTGTSTIGAGGTPITKHLSMTVNPTFPPLKGGAFCTAASFMLAGAADGDTIALGVPNARMSGGLVYTAWVSAANTITVQVCAFPPNPTTAFGSGAIRVDLWKH